MKKNKGSLLFTWQQPVLTDGKNLVCLSNNMTWVAIVVDSVLSVWGCCQHFQLNLHYLSHLQWNFSTVQIQVKKQASKPINCISSICFGFQVMWNNILEKLEVLLHKKAFPILPKNWMAHTCPNKPRQVNIQSLIQFAFKWIHMTARNSHLECVFLRANCCIFSFRLFV